jgi:sulfite exporter TauE/SafE
MQLFGLGVFWVSLHCAGMCGPIMAGLTTAGAPEGSRTARAWHGAKRVLAYQGGRALTYAALGATVGALGQAVEAHIHGLAGVAGLTLAALLILGGLIQVPALRALLPRRLAALLGGGGGAGRWIGKVLGGLNRRWPKALPGRMVAVGALMGLLPCMLMFWVLSLSASTASPLHGALIMMGLVGMTTPVLLVAGCAPLLAGSSWLARGRALLPAAIALSGVWLGLISAADQGWIEHVFHEFVVDGRTFYVMFW